MAEPEPDPDEYARRLERRGAIVRGTQIVQLLAALLIGGGFAAWQLYEVIDDWTGPPPKPPAIVVRVASDGALRADGCADPVAVCAAAALAREEQRPGGGSYECVVAPAAGSPEAARREAIRACLEHRLMPTVLPPR